MKSIKVFSCFLLPASCFLFFASLVLSKESSVRLGAKPLVWRDEIPAQFSHEVEEITAHPTFVRHPHPQISYLTAEFYDFLLQDWDLACRLAKTLDVKGYEVRKLDQGWRVILSPRTSADVLPLIHRNGRSFFLAKGEHRGKVIRHLKLRVFLLVEYHSSGRESLSASGETVSRIESAMTSYIRIEQFFLAVIAKITIPFVGERIDRKMAAILQDIEQVSQKIHENPAAVREAIERNPNFTPAEKQTLKKYL